MVRRPEAFLDTSALFAGLWSRLGGARQVLLLGEAGLVRLTVSPQVLAEIESVLRRKAPDLLVRLALLLDTVGLVTAPPAPEARLRAALAVTSHPGDARVLADAWESRVDYFITLDRQHFLANAPAAERIPFPLGTPGDFLRWYRENFVVGLNPESA